GIVRHASMRKSWKRSKRGTRNASQRYCAGICARRAKRCWMGWGSRAARAKSKRLTTGKSAFGRENMNAPTEKPLRFHPPRTDKSELAAHLRKHVQGEVLFDRASRGRYATDASIYQVEPVGVLVPATHE